MKFLICLGKLKPHQILSELSTKYDELTQPTGLKQIYNVLQRNRQKENEVNGHLNNFADQIRHLENLVSENSPYVRSVLHTSGRTPSVVLFHDEQIEDLKNVCRSGEAVLGIDKTFNLCKMHVTVTCFKQTSVNRVGTENHPIFLGPMFIHDNSDFESYCHFLHQIKVKISDSPLDKLVIGSDDEKAMVKAIRSVFPDATHVLCTFFRHLEENVRDNLTKDAVTLS